jgi:splicing factor 3B subunit 1
VYNALYIGSQAALVSAYPRLPDDGRNTYRRMYLELFV